jgi:hypothetical protein
MTSTYTTNKSIEKPGNGDYVNTWNVPVNSDWDIIDASLGGTTTLNATGASGTTTLTASQYRPPTLIVAGVLTANVTYSLPSGIGGHWVIYNNTSGAHTVTFASAGGGTSTLITQGSRVLVYCDGTNTALGVTSVSVAAGGASGDVQYNNGGALDGSSNFTFDGTNLVLGATSVGEMRVRNSLKIYGTTSGYVGLTVPSAAGGTTYTLPNADGTNGQVLSTDGAGTLSWATASGGGTSGVSSFSGGSTGLTPSSPATGDVVLGGTLGIASGGTGAANAATARSNILPSYTGNASKVLAVNSGATDVEWITNTANTGNITFSTNTISTSGTNQDMLLVPNGTGRVYINGLQVGPGKGSSSTNTVFGSSAGNSFTSGTYNVTIGHFAGNAITSGSENICIGFAGDLNLKTSSANTYIGHFAGSYPSGSANVAIGRTALGLAGAGNSNTAIGYQALLNSAGYSNSSGLGASTDVTGSNQVQLGNSSTTTYAYGAVQNRSDVRDKADIQDTDLGLNFVMALKPRKFRWDMREDYKPPMPDINTSTQEQMSAWKKACDLGNITHNGSKKRNRFHQGLIAQEVKATMDAMGVDFGGYQDHLIKDGQDVKSIGYNELIAPLIKAVQELKAELDAYKASHP